MRMGRHIWNYDYQDFRLIFEQSDELHYFYIKSKTQRFVARSTVIVLFSLMIILTLLVFHSGFSVWRYSKLEASKIEAEQKKQEAIIDALATLSESDVDDTKDLTQEHLLKMAQIYKDRLKKTKLLVQYSSQELSQANHALEQGLKAAGISHGDIEKSLKGVVFNSSHEGGPSKELGLGTSVDQDLNLYKNALERNQSINALLGAIPTATPVQGAFIASGFGPRIHPVTGKLTLHEGLDYVPSFDQYAKSVLSGVVEIVKNDPEGYGNMVVVAHSDGVKTLYGHLAYVSVTQGQKVEKGVVLGKIGNTGLSTGTHLHFEIMVKDTKVNPSIIMAMAKNVQ